MDGSPRQANVELKARYPDPDRAEAVCREIGATREWIDVQTDTYFSLGAYRMKLRESARKRHELIWYRRADRKDARVSSYRVMAVPDPEEKKRIFGTSMGIKAVVTKERTLYLWKGVRIHVDRVEELGGFLEFEAVLGPGLEEEEGRRRVEELTERFGIRPRDLVPASYSDLIVRLAASS